MRDSNLPATMKNRWLPGNCFEGFWSQVIVETKRSLRGWACNALNLWVTTFASKAIAQVEKQSWWSLEAIAVWIGLTAITLRQIGKGLHIIAIKFRNTDCQHVPINLTQSVCDTSLWNRGRNSTGLQLAAFWLYSCVKHSWWTPTVRNFTVKSLSCSNYVTDCEFLF